MNTEFTSAETKSDVIVVGGGAAGMMAALFAARNGARALLLEQNEKLGKKIYITGKGRCNLTNTADREAFLNQVPRNPRFLMSALSHFDCNTTVELFNSLGMPTKEERGGRVFPVSDKASDVTRALRRGMDEAGVAVCLNTHIIAIWREEDEDRSVTFRLRAEGGREFTCSAVVLATGGFSYPATGATGEGYRLAAALGHNVIPCSPSLVGMNMKSNWHERLQGLALKNVRLSAKIGKRLIYNEIGEMLFTHFGISGPLVLELSAHMPEDIDNVRVLLNMKPGLTTDQLDKRLVREFEAAPRKKLSSVMGTLLPARFAGIFPEICEIDPDTLCCNITKEQRKHIRIQLSEMVLPVTGLRGFDEAIITRGGVDVKSIAPGTMMSKNRSGLFFAGEMLDVDAHTGGFNLQIAWSTGSLAGRCAAVFAKQQTGGFYGSAKREE